ncbi:Zinc finger, PMZ-type [Corchorus olitorius]|uniref:Protein FAR1-RELATED SEQUENCE n=1 Tax=Corchorus olitorius TaxID=93759 RepID=A0A1R3KX57_9ROSI|nr:Zinc finger, PMZ-type [Corchorus olitorius]
MGQVYGALPKTFQVEFDKCVNKSETPEEFESAWQLLVDKYNLRGNEWLQSLYIDRKLWVSTYVRDTFFAGMYTTQQSKSVNSLFDGYVHAGTTLQDFAEQYEKALNDRSEKEARAEFETFYTKPVLKTPLPIEKQAAEVYTRKLFSVFQDEIYESLVLAVKSNDDDGLSRTYEVARFDEENKVYLVGLNITDHIASCSCKMFEFEGILCRHVLAVFKAANIFLLPQHYILKRWTRNAKAEAILDTLPSGEMHDNNQKGKNSQYNLLYQEAVKCAEEGMASDHSFKVALNALREARIKIITAKKNAINAEKLETTASTNYQDENNTVASQVDSSSELVTLPDHQQAKLGDSCAENNITRYPSEQSSNRVSICTNCKCPGHDSHSCLWLKDARGSTSLIFHREDGAFTALSSALFAEC